MRSLRRNRPIVALLLAVLLPLQSFAAIFGCAQQHPGQHERHARMAHAHCAEHGTQGAAGGAGVAHHGCADCCMAAVAQTTPLWTAPRAEAAVLSLPQFRARFMTSLDRLDRPPRNAPV